MKQLLILSSCVLSLISAAQTTFSVAQVFPALAITANATINVSTSPSNVHVRTYDIQNISTSTVVYNVKKYELSLHATATSTAELSFSFGGCDFAPTTQVGLCTLTLNPGQNSGPLGPYFSLDCRIYEANTAGYSVVKYSIYNINQVSDSLQFTLRYNYLLQGNGLQDFQQSTLLNLQPNPARDLVSLKLNSKDDSEVNIEITNITGKVVLDKIATLQAGENNIELDLQGFSPGLYYLCLHNQNAVISRKLVIE